MNKGIRRKCEHINISINVIDNNTLNASAVKLDDIDYMMTFNHGIWACIDDLYKENHNFFEKKLQTLNTFKKDGIYLNHFFEHFILTFLFGHELGHIIRSHHDLGKKSDTINENQIIDLNLNIFNSTTLLKDKNNLRFLIESDADASAGLIIASAIKQQYSNLITINNIVNKQNLFIDLIKYTTYSIYMITNEFNYSYSKDSNYPMPFLRFAIIQGHIAIQLDKYKILSQKEMEKIFIESLFEIYTYLEKNNKNYNAYNSKDLINIIEIKYKEMKELNQIISKYKFC